MEQHTTLNVDGALMVKRILCSLSWLLDSKIIGKSHGSWYSIHQGEIKIYRDLKWIYWLSGMKKDIAEFVVEVS